MRFLKIFITVLVLAGAFAAYLVYQPGVAQRSDTYKPPAVQDLQANAGNLIVGQGQNAWVRQFDEEGHLSSRFRAAKWDPMGNGLLKVTKPEAELYVRGKDNARAKITIQGTDGEVVMDGLPEASSSEATLDPKGMGDAAGPTQPPSSGRLNGVVICVYETDTAAEPAVTMRTNNIVFDNETFRISTETYAGPDGTPVPSDQVAVSVEGRDFDFYGRGLTVRWNDVDQRLEMLRIAHGDRLVVKNPGTFSGSLYGDKNQPKAEKGEGAAAIATPSDQLHSGGLWRPLREMLVSADPAAAGAAIEASGEQPAAGKGKGRRKKQVEGEAAAPKPQRRREQPPYRAAFNEKVRVLEGEETRATADLMNVDFLMGGASGAKKPKRPATQETATQETATTAPATAPATPPAEASALPSPDEPSTQPAADDQSTLLPETRPATAPSTTRTGNGTETSRPQIDPAGSQPITIYWVGELTVTPLDPASVQYPPAPGEAGIEMVGTSSPVNLTRENTKVVCARFAYRTDGTLAMEKSEAFPEIVLTHRPADPAAAAEAKPDEVAPAPTTVPATAVAQADTKPNEATPEAAPAPAPATTVAAADRKPNEATPAPDPAPLAAPATTAPSNETVVTTESVHYSFPDRIATLRGRSRVTAPVQSKRPEESGTLDAAWTNVATFHLAGQRQEELSVERAEFTGDVDVNGPQGKVKAQQIALLFDPPTAQPKKPKRAKGEAGDAASPAGPANPAGAAAPAPQPFAQSKQPNLRRIIATTDVSCEMVDAREGRRSVECQRLELETAKSEDGRLYPRVIDAAGSVHASDASQDLRSEHVVLTLKPAPPTESAAGETSDEEAGDEEAGDGKEGGAKAKRKQDKAVAAVALDSVLATGGVRVTSKDGAVATGQRLEITTGEGGGDPHIELSGEPAQVADATNGTLTGRTIIVDPKTGVAHIPGEGSLRTVQRSKEEVAQGKPGRPIEVSWDEAADLLADDNRIDVAGSVMLRITEPDGTVRTASAGKVSVELVDKPKAPDAPDADAKPRREHARADARRQAGGNAGEAPAERGEALAERGEAPAGPGETQGEPHDALAKAGKPAGAPEQGPLAASSFKMDVFKDKEIGVVTFREDAVVNSHRLAPDGTVIQRFHLKAPVVTYDVGARNLAVPGPGRMLVENHADPAAKPPPKGKERPEAPGQPKQAKAGAKAAPEDDIAAVATGNGATAFEWTTGLEFEEAAGKATMEGGVVVTHQPDDGGEPPVRLDADELVASFASAAPDAQRPRDGAKGEAGAAGDVPKMQIKSVSAVGNIVITRQGAELTAGRIDYDPSTQWVIARGDDRNPAAFSDPNGTQSTTARELWLNTKTWHVTIKGANVRVGGLTRPAR